MKTKIIFIAIGAFGLLICAIIIAYILTQKPQQQNLPQTTSQIPTSIPTSNIANPPAQINSSPEDVAKTFYSWYISYPGSAFSSEAFKNSPYLSERFKISMTHALRNSPDNTYDPIFCPDNKTNDFAVENASYNEDNTMANVIIHRNNIDGKNLYRITLIYNKNKWIIDDTICLL